MSSVVSKMNGTPRELNQGGTSTSEVAFTTDGTTPVVLPLLTAEQLCSANGKKSRPIAIHYGGRVVGGTTTNFTPQLQFGTSATPGSNTDVESGAAVAVNSVTGTWFGYCYGIISKDNHLSLGSLQLTEGSTVTLTALAKQDNAVSTADPDSNTTLGFVVTGTFSSGHASNAAYLDYFFMTVEDE